MNVKNVKILAVDDKQSNLIALEAVFSGTHFQIIEAHSGQEALDILAAEPDISLVLLDVQMPEMDGFEVAAKIKKMECCLDIPIIFITAVFSEDPFVKKGYEAGAIDYFSKPFDPDILKLKVEMYTSYRQKFHLLKEREKRVSETEALLKAGRKLSEIFESLTVGVLIADKDGKIGQTNEVVSKVLRIDQKIKNNSYGEILTWWDGDGHKLKIEGGLLYRALTDGESTHNEAMEIIVLDGTKLNIVASASPLYTVTGSIAGAVVVIQDVTESKRLEEDFENKLSELISLGIGFEASTMSNSLKT